MKNTNRAKTHRQTIPNAYRTIPSILLPIVIVVIASILLSAGKPQSTATTEDVTLIAPVESPAAAEDAAPIAPVESPAATETPRILSKEDIKDLLVNGVTNGSDEIWYALDKKGYTMFRITSSDGIRFDQLDDAVLDKIVDNADQKRDMIRFPNLYQSKKTDITLTSLEDNILHGTYSQLNYGPALLSIELDLNHLTNNNFCGYRLDLDYVKENASNDEFFFPIYADVTEFEVLGEGITIIGMINIRFYSKTRFHS